MAEQASSTFPQTTVSGSLDKLTKSGALSSYHTALPGIPGGQNSVLPLSLVLPGKWGRRKRRRKKAATTQFDIVRSDSFLRDGGLLPRPGLGLQPPAKGLCRRLAIFGGS